MILSQRPDPHGIESHLIDEWERTNYSNLTFLYFLKFVANNKTFSLTSHQSINLTTIDTGVVLDDYQNIKSK
jgi:hypothetical protein